MIWQEIIKCSIKNRILVLTCWELPDPQCVIQVFWKITVHRAKKKKKDFFSNVCFFLFFISMGPSKNYPLIMAHFYPPNKTRIIVWKDDTETYDLCFMFIISSFLNFVNCLIDNLAIWLLQTKLNIKWCTTITILG